MWLGACVVVWRSQKKPHNVSFPNLEPIRTGAQVTLNCLEKGKPHNQSKVSN